MEQSDWPASEAKSPTAKRPRSNQLRVQRKSVRQTAVESTWVPLAPKTIGHVESLRLVALRVPKIPRGLLDLTHTEVRTMTRQHEEELLSDIDYLYNLELRIENQEKLVAQKVASIETLEQWARDHGSSPNGDHSAMDSADNARQDQISHTKAVERLQHSGDNYYQWSHSTTICDTVKLAALKTVLDPVICQQVDRARLTTWTQFLAHMDAHYPDTCWSNHYLVGLQGKTLFKGKPIDQAAALAKEAAWHLGGTSFWAIKLVELLLGQFAADLKYAPSDLWDIHALSSAQLESHIQRIVKEVKLGQTRVQIQHDFAATCPTASKPTAKPAPKPAPTTEPAPTPAEDNKAKQRRRNREARLKARIDELEALLKANPAPGKA
ncbi:hypothetical protein H4R35_004858 [Dimargaris xerosporica]|nr:hypothetical protein H4R35_004858 [Dimargaris xerosporica]